MKTFRQGTVVRVPFPYTDRPARQYRPALVVSARLLGTNANLLWVLMITSADNRGWPGDIELGERYGEFGLPAPSVIRTSKIATVESSEVSALGLLAPDVLSHVLEHVNAAMTD